METIFETSCLRGIAQSKQGKVAKCQGQIDLGPQLVPKFQRNQAGVSGLPKICNAKLPSDQIKSHSSLFKFPTRLAFIKGG